MMLTLLRAGWHGRAVHVFMNNGDGTFRDETSSRIPDGGNVAANGQFVPDLELTDFNNDGHLDICMIYGSMEQANQQAYAGRPVTNIAILMLNDGAGGFSFHTGENIGLGNSRMLPVTGGYIHHEVGIYAPAGEYQNWQGGSELYFMSGRYGTAKNREDGATFGAAGFNEAYYLNSNAYVKDLVTGGQLASGLDHYLMVGRSEGRLGMARSRHSIIMKNAKNYIVFYLN